MFPPENLIFTPWKCILELLRFSA